MSVFTSNKSKYTEKEIDNMRRRHEDSQQAKVFFRRTIWKV